MSNANTWNSLPKTINDSQTIAEFIAAQLATHNADDSAHGQSDEAIYNHRISTILDHLDQSITKSKFIFSLSDGLLFQENGSGFNAWSVVGTSEEDGVFASLFSIVAQIANNPPARGDAMASFCGYVFDYTSDNSYLDFVADFSNSDTLDSWISFGFGTLNTSATGFGFRYKESNQHLYAYHRIGTTFYETDLGTDYLDTFHRFRIEYNANVFTFYIDNVLVATHDSNIPDTIEDSLIDLGLKAKTGCSGFIEIKFMEFYQSQPMVI